MGAKGPEPYPQRELLYHLRGAIDVAMRTGRGSDRETALDIAYRHPQSLRSRYILHNLGESRLRWLEEHGGLLPGETGTLPGEVQMTATPTKLG